MKLQDFKSIHASGKDLVKIISAEQVIWSAEPSRMMWRVDNRPEGRVLVIYPEYGDVAIARGNVGIYNSATGKTEKPPTDVVRVETVGKLILQGNMNSMFYNSQVKNVYVRNSAEKSKFEQTSNLPSGIRFIVK